MSSITLTQSGIDDLELIKYVVLIPLYTLATGGVIVGLYWERSKFTPPKQKRGSSVLWWSLVVEMFSSTLIFASDGTISHTQERAIVQLTTPRRLSDAEKDRLADVAKRFPAEPFLTMTNPEAEPWNLALQISGELKKDGWNWLSWVPPNLCPSEGRPCERETIADHIEIRVHPGSEAIGKALAEAIRDPTIFGMADVEVVPDGEVGVPVIIVGSKL